MVEVKVDALVLSDYEQGIAKLFAWGENDWCGGVKMYVGIYSFFAPCLFAKVHYFLWSTSTFDGLDWNSKDSFASFKVLSEH